MLLELLQQGGFMAFIVGVNGVSDASKSGSSAIVSPFSLNFVVKGETMERTDQEAQKLFQTQGDGQSHVIYATEQFYTDLKTSMLKKSSFSYNGIDEEMGKIWDQVLLTKNELYEDVLSILQSVTSDKIHPSEGNSFHERLARDPNYHNKVHERRYAEWNYEKSLITRIVEDLWPETEIVLHAENPDDCLIHEAREHKKNLKTGRFTEIRGPGPLFDEWYTNYDKLEENTFYFRESLAQELAVESGLKKNFFGYWVRS